MASARRRTHDPGRRGRGARAAALSFERWGGLLRSLVIYWRPGRQRGLRRFYAEWVRPGDLVFDVGAHVGDRTAAFQALGARVVAFEPQPDVRALLTRIVGTRPGVTIRGQAVGPTPGLARLAVSRRTPTVSSLAHGWRARLPDANPGFRAVRWEDAIDVPVTTLDALVAEYGEPSFCKIDVEGFEADVLAGLSTPVAGVSFEWVAGALDVPVACVRRLATLGRYAFNAVPGETRRYVFERWMDADETVRWLEKGADGIASGDVYARRLPPTTPAPDGAHHG